jgi:hypothetical protein
MKTLQLIPLFAFLILASCSSVRVYSDYDKGVEFSQFKSYAFHKNSIDKVEISDLDKKRILRAIDQNLQSRGFTKSDNPDFWVSIQTKEREQVDVNQANLGWGWGWGWGWNPWMWGGNTYVSSYTEGTLFIDFIDARKKELIWQGEGVGILTKNTKDKEERITEFVTKILNQYPPKK